MKPQQYLLLILLLLGTYSFAQTDYEALWKSVEKKEIKQQYHDLLEEVDHIYERADKEGKDTELVRAFLYKVKYDLLLKKDIEQEVYQHFVNEIDCRETPVKQLLSSVLAKSLEDYVRRYGYQISQRSQTDKEGEENEFQFWNVEHFQREIIKYYKASLENPEQLAALKDRDFDYLLKGVKESKDYKTSLLDILASRYQNHLMAYVGRTTEDKSDFWKASADFIRIPISESEEFSYINELKSLFQQIEKIHSNNSNRMDLLTYELERLEFAFGSDKTKLDLYEERLQNLKNNYSGKTEQLWIRLALARFYADYADKNDQPDFNQKALEQLQPILELKEGSKLISIAKNIHKKIMFQNLRVTTENYGSPQKPSRALVHFRNIDTLYLSVYTNLKPELNDGLVQVDSVWKLLDDHKLTVQKEYVLPKVNNGFEYSAELLLPQLESGHHVLIFSSHKNPDYHKDVYIWREIQVSQLAFIQSWDGKELQFYVTDRDSGKPVSDVKVDFQLKKSPKSKENHQLITDSDGLASLELKKVDDMMEIMGNLSKGDDRLVFGNQSYLWPQREEDDYDNDDYELHSHLLTDRLIFRPGQTVYFKGFVTFYNKNKAKMADGFKVSIGLYDPSNNLVEEKILTTNKMGTVEGEFKLPKNGQTGSYTLEIDEEVEKGKWQKYVDAFEENDIDIQVEEYKRPRFEVKFDDLTETYFLGDQVELKVNAKAFFGGNLSQAQVRYTVKRSLNYNRAMDYQLYRKYNQPETIKTGELQTDAQGNFQLDFMAESENELKEISGLVFNYIVDAEVTDINGETQRAQRRLQISNTGIEANLMGVNEVVLGKENKLTLDFTDLNQTSTEAKGQLKIYRYDVPNRILKERVWKIPEHQMISKEDFRKYYPYEAYDSLDLKENWSKQLISVLEIPKTEKWELKYDEVEGLEAGEYVLVFEGEGIKNLPLKAQKSISISIPDQPKVLTEFVQVDYELNGTSKAPILKAQFDASETTYVLWEVANGKNWKSRKVLELKKGKNVFEIKIPKNTKTLGSTYAYIKANANFAERRNVYQKASDIEALHFEIEHLTDKMRPGNKESWKLKLVDEDGKPVKGEVLASMYDASLDGFIKGKTDWNIKLGERPWYYSYSQPNLSRINHASFGRNTSYGFNTSQIYGSVQGFFEVAGLETFGYDFVNADRKQYLYLAALEFKYSTETADLGTNQIQGLILDEEGFPVPMVHVYLDSENTTSTDFNGRFVISAAIGDVLRISAVGYPDTTVKISSQRTIVYLERGAILEDVLITAYDAPVQMKRAELQGKVSGLTSSGAPGAVDAIVIRGANSIEASTEVLYVVDGKPMSAQEIKQLNVDEILQVRVLNTEEAIKIYGSQGANGVVLITTKAGLEAIENITPRENLKETAFFYPMLQTDKNGRISIEFDAPEALTRWKFQAFGHDKNLRNAHLVHHSLTQKELNIIPNFPRFFRAGDKVQISAKVNNLSDKVINGQVLLKLINEITQEELELTSEKSVLKAFTVDAEGNTDVFWEIEIPEGVEALRYEIAAKSGNFTDAETNIIPVLSQREFLTESLALWVEPHQEKSFVLENLKNQNSQSLENHQLIFDFTARPIWTALEAMPYLTAETYASADRVFDLYHTYTLGEQILAENKDVAELIQSWYQAEDPDSRWDQNEEVRNLILEASPWLKTALSQKEQQQNLAKLLNKENTTQQRQEALSKLLELQLPSGGFPWFKGGRESIAISTHILIGMGRLGLPENEVLQEKYKEITDGLVTYLDNEFLTQFVKSEGNIEQYFGIQSLYYLYCRSFFDTERENVKTYQKEAFKKLESEWNTMNFHEKVIFTLVAQKYNRSDLAQDLLEALKQTTVINSDEGMYWKENTKNFGWYESSVFSHSLAVEAFDQAGADKETINALKTWLIKQKQSQAWTNSRASLMAIHALLIDAGDWKSDSSFPEVWIGNQKIDFNNAAGKAGYFKKEFAAKEIQPTMAEVKIVNNGSSPQYGGLYWQYFENADKVQAAKSDELEVRKSIFVNRNSDKGKTLVSADKAEIKVGDKLTIQIKIKALADFEFMHLKDARISGVEPVETLSGYRGQDGLYYYQSHKDLASHFFFDRLPKGSYVFEYEVVVNNVGDFAAGFSQLQSLYAPEFSAQTSGERIEFKEMK